MRSQKSESTFEQIECKKARFDVGSEKDRQDVATDEKDPKPAPPEPGEMSERDLDDVSGGRASIPDVTKKPAPGGPVPVPYPNVT